jgi:hypothetical protein
MGLTAPTKNSPVWVSLHIENALVIVARALFLLNDVEKSCKVSAVFPVL